MLTLPYPGPTPPTFPTAPSRCPRACAYIENSPATFFGKSRSFAAQYNWEFLLRYGLTDDLEFRLFSSGYSATLSHPRTTGFSPLAFDFKYHMWDENLDLHIPLAALEIYILTPFGSNYFSGGTQPSIALLLDHTLPFDILLEHNFGLTGIEDTFGGAVYEFSYQWALQRQVFKDFAIFTHGFLNASCAAADADLPATHRQRARRSRTLLPLDPTDATALLSPRSTQVTPAQLVIGGGFLWNLSTCLSLFGSYNVGLGGLAANPRPARVRGRLVSASPVPRTAVLSRLTARSPRARSTSSSGFPACRRRVCRCTACAR